MILSLYKESQLNLKKNYELYKDISQYLYDLDSAIKYKNIGISEGGKLLNLILYYKNEKNEKNLSCLNLYSNKLYLNKELITKELLSPHEKSIIEFNNSIDNILSNIHKLLDEKLIIFSNNKFKNNINVNFKNNKGIEILYINELQIRIPDYHFNTKDRPLTFFSKIIFYIAPFYRLNKFINNSIYHIEKINDEIFYNKIKRFMWLMSINITFTNGYSNIINIILEYLGNDKLLINTYIKIIDFYKNNKDNNNINMDFRKKLSEYILYC